MATTFNTLFFVVTLTVSVLSGLWLHDPSGIVTKKTLLRALQGQVAYSPDAKVYLGYNSCLDMVGRALDVTSALGGWDRAAATDHEELASVQAFQESFLLHFSSGVAVERLFTSDTAFDAVVSAAQASGKFALSIGGNAAIMGKVFAELISEHSGAGSVHLGGVVGKDLGQLLGSRVAVIPADAGVATRDEVHLILEYAAGDAVAGKTAARSNRYIVSSDRSNGRLASMEPFHAAVLEASGDPQGHPDLIVIAGLHMVDKAVADVAEYRTQRLRQVRMALGRQKGSFPDIPVHVELASVAEAAHMTLISESALVFADSTGMNEQELPFLYETLGGNYSESQNGVVFTFKREDLTGSGSDVPACPRAVSVVLRFLLERFSTLSRVHFHSLHFHIVAQRTGSSYWRSSASSVAAGVTVTTLRACNVTHESQLHGNDLDLKAKLTITVTDPLLPAGAPADVRSLIVGSPIATWEWAVSHGSVEFSYAPVLVCKAPKRTVGLGDSISASGLLAHLRLHRATTA